VINCSLNSPGRCLKIIDTLRAALAVSPTLLAEVIQAALRSQQIIAIRRSFSTI